MALEVSWCHVHWVGQSLKLNREDHNYERARHLSRLNKQLLIILKNAQMFSLHSLTEAKEEWLLSSTCSTISSGVNEFARGLYNCAPHWGQCQYIMCSQWYIPAQIHHSHNIAVEMLWSPTTTNHRRVFGSRDRSLAAPRFGDIPSLCVFGLKQAWLALVLSKNKVGMTFEFEL